MSLAISLECHQQRTPEETISLDMGNGLGRPSGRAGCERGPGLCDTRNRPCETAKLAAKLNCWGLACETRQNAPLVEARLMVARRGRTALGQSKRLGRQPCPYEVPLSHLSHIHTHLAHQLSDVKIIRVGMPPGGQRAGLLPRSPACARINANPGVPHLYILESLQPLLSRLKGIIAPQPHLKGLPRSAGWPAIAPRRPHQHPCCWLAAVALPEGPEKALS
jgi:hypothetical protein